MVTFGTFGFLLAVVALISAERAAICDEGCKCAPVSDSGAAIVNCTGASLHRIPQVDAFMFIINNDEISTIKKNSFNYPSASKIRVLSLQKNGISALEPNAFVGLTELDSLYMSQNSITKLESNIFRGLHHVSTLGLTDNKISLVYSSAFEGLVSLRTLYLAGNHIRALSPDVFHHNLKLYDLSLSDNFPLRLPTDTPFLKSSSLRILNMSYCGFEELPPLAFQGTPNLQQIDLANNYLANGPYSFHNLLHLAFLNLEENGIETLEPNVFKDLQSLKTLHLNGNKIRSLHPNTFQGNSQLTLLTLNNNELSTMKMALFVPLIHLEELDLLSNHFTCDCRLQTVYLWCLNQNVTIKAECASINGSHILPWTSLEEINCAGESAVVWVNSTISPSSDLQKDTLRVSSWNMYILVVVCALVFILLVLFFAFIRRRYNESSTPTAYDVSAASEAGGTYNSFPMGEVTSVIINSNAATISDGMLARFVIKGHHSRTPSSNDGEPTEWLHTRSLKRVIEPTGIENLNFDVSNCKPATIGPVCLQIIMTDTLVNYINHSKNMDKFSQPHQQQDVIVH